MFSYFSCFPAHCHVNQYCESFEFQFQQNSYYHSFHCCSLSYYEFLVELNVLVLYYKLLPNECKC